jgi:beta-N-acetylhexosaminidase
MLSLTRPARHARRIFIHLHRTLVAVNGARLLSIILLAAILASLLAPFSAARAQSPVDDLLRKLSPEEKVGQLFLVTFNGAETTPQSPIYDLVVNYHVGGVVLTAANDNFVAAPDTTAGAYRLITNLQRAAFDDLATPVPGTKAHTRIPLFIGISQEGGGSPNDQILNGLTLLPDQMALGATWDVSLAQQAGEDMGQELSVLGFNLYMGLSLDVMTQPSLTSNSDLNTRVFGGDPYWVGQLGRAYITGLHTGSGNRMAVVAKYFPGRGGSDRPADEEVASVRRSLEELKQIELAPFFDVTGNATAPAMTTDGLLVSHIRYQGFQGNIRATTRPISFDQQALNQILGLPQLQTWRTSGGLIISDDLGTQAVRRFYDPDRISFSARSVARDAFLAGNDLLYMGNIISSDAQDNHETIVKTLIFFAQKYREDSAFAQRVDESLRRILSAKLRLYPNFDLTAILPAPEGAASLAASTELVFAVARKSATLISPSVADLPSVLPAPPNALDYIVFLSDTRFVRQCSACPDTAVLPSDAFQSAVVRLYGPTAGALATPSHLSSYSFGDLELLLNDRLTTPDMLNDLRRANIIVISTLDLPAGQSQIENLRRFLVEKQSLLANKRVILFAFGAPIFLDATDISKLTAYYGMYSESAPFIDVAARLLFQEIAPTGSLPVSVAGTGYDLTVATSPDPSQVISLRQDEPPSAGATPEVSPTPELTPAAQLFRVGDTISLRTGAILDHNQHQVPDGTVVRFVLSQGESGLIQQVESVTANGVATAKFRLDQSGLIEIRAASEPARVSDTLQLNVSKEGGPVIIITPTLQPTAVPPTVMPTPTSTPVPEPIESPAMMVTSKGYPTFLGWFLVLMVLAAGVGLAYWLGAQAADARWAIRWALLVFVGGIVAYNYLVLDFPGTQAWLNGRGLPGFLQAVLVGEAIGFAIGWFWRLAAESGNQAQEQ